jgi:hypothetical protein
MKGTDYILLGLGVIILLGIVIRLRKYTFYEFDENQVVFSRLWLTSKLFLDNKNINEIWICTIQGKITNYFIACSFGSFKINPDRIEEREIKSFAIRNDITLKHEEGFHGGGVTTLYESKKIIL